MKNKNLWLSLIIAIGVIFLMTWVIPSTVYDDSGSLVLGTIKPTGIMDFFYYISMLVTWFGQNVIFIISLGVFYGVINKTGSLRLLVDKISSVFKKREKVFLLITASAFILVSGLTGINFPLIFFIPLFIGVLLSLGFNKITALIATVASIMVGIIGSLYSTTLYAAVANYIETGISHGWFKLSLIAIGLLLVNLYLFFTAKVVKGKGKEEIDEKMLFIEKEEGPKNPKMWPLVTAFGLIFVLFVLGLTPWEKMFGFAGFTEFHTKLIEVQIGNFAIFKSILGAGTAAFGNWDVADASALIMLVTLVLVFAYRINWEDVYKGILSGIKRLLPTMALVLLVNLVFVLGSQASIINTVIKAIAGITEGFNVFTYSLTSFLGAILVNETYITNYVTSTLNTVLGGTADLPLLLFVQQVMYGLAMLVAPTSVMLLVGLSYLEVGYTRWLKAIWKPMLILSAVSILVLSIVTVL